MLKNNLIKKLDNYGVDVGFHVSAESPEEAWKKISEFIGKAMAELYPERQGISVEYYTDEPRLEQE